VAQPRKHLELDGKLICDAVSTGMSKDATSPLVEERNLHPEERVRHSQTRQIEEVGFRRTILFDGSGSTVVKKKKTIVTE
jgi:hypothetical protein